MVELLALGATGVQLGTAFLCCPEAGITREYKEALLRTQKGSTVLTKAFSGKLARGIDNLFIQRMKAHENHILNYPIQNALTTSMRKESKKQKNINFMSMWAGEGAPLCKCIPAAELIKEINDELM